MPSAPNARLIAAITLVAVLLAACSPRGGDELTDADSPIAREMAAVGWWHVESVEEIRDRTEREARRSEDLTAACMREQGFDYTPFPQPPTIIDPEESRGGLSVREYTERYGYGNSTWELTPAGRAHQEAPPVEEVDPNTTRVLAMSSAERSAWYRALYGDWTLHAAEVEVGEPAFGESENLGCRGAAAAQVQAESASNPRDQLLADPAFAELDENLARVEREGLRSDPRWLDVEARWAQCMADAGHPGLASPLDGDAQRSITPALIGRDADTPWEDLSTDEISQVRTLEIERAIADLDCQEEVDWEGSYRRILFALQEEFIAENREDFDALIAAAMALE